jgi:hypothetical protein
MDAMNADPKVDQLKASLRTVAQVLGNMAMHLRLAGLHHDQVTAILLEWNSYFIERAFGCRCDHD